MTSATRLILAASLLSLAGCATAHTSLLTPDRQTIPTTPAGAPDTSKLDSAEVRVLEKTLRDLLLKNLPDPIVKSDRGWGHQKETTVRTNFLKDGPRLRSEPVKEMRNDGTWRRLSV